MTGLTVEEFIKVLEKFPQDSQICITNSEGAFEGDFLLGVFHESDYDYESGDGYDIVGISVLATYNQMNYAWLVHDCEQEIYGDKVWTILKIILKHGIVKVIGQDYTSMRKPRNSMTGTKDCLKLLVR